MGNRTAKMIGSDEKYAYVPLFHLNKRIMKNTMFSITVESKVDMKNLENESYVGIYFVPVQPKQGKEMDILFSFDIKPPKQIILCACVKGEWKKEVVMEDENLAEKLFEKPFELSIRPIAHHDEVGSEILVFVNNELITTFQCSGDITSTKYIGFSKTIRICANMNDFSELVD